MIHFDNWQIKKDSEIIARQYDNLSRRLDILGDFPEGWNWELLVQTKGKLDVIALSPTEGGVGVLLTASMLALGGQYAVQLRGTQGEAVRHTNVLYSVLIPESLVGGEAWPTVPSAVEQALQQLEELNQHPPYPGDNGYWMVWDLDTNAYVQSQFPLPPVAEGPPGAAATIELGTVTTGDPGTQARVTNSGTENAAIFNFTIPRGAVGPTGATPDISVQVSGLPADSDPTVDVSGPPEAPVIALGIPAGPKGEPGTPGTNGTNGTNGVDGQTPNITTGTVETLPAGSDATASITGQTPNLMLNLGIPQGPAGAGVPPTDTAAEGDVPTWNGESVVWAPPAGGEKPWALLLEELTQETVQSILVSQDTLGNPFSVSELIFDLSLPILETLPGYLRFVNGLTYDVNSNLIATFSGIGSTSTIWYGFAWMKILGGGIPAVVSGGSKTNIYNAPTNIRSYGEEIRSVAIQDERITSFGVYFQNGLEAGAKIRIWGR